MNHSLQDFYAILHHPQQPIFLLKDIIPFWKSYKPHWFSHLPLHEFQPIHTIYENTLYHNLSLLLHYDQIIRHPTHLQPSPNKLILKFATQIAFRILHFHYDELEDWQKVFTLLTFRHNKSHKLKLLVLHKIYKELNIHHFTTNEHNPTFTFSPLWLRFLEATLYDIYDGYKITEELVTHKQPTDFIDLLEKQITRNKPLNFKDDYPYEKIAVSLSGGIDSALLAYIFSNTSRDIVLLHICYHNRPECQQEVEFLTYFAHHICRRPLYVLHLNLIKRMRNTKYRDMYERTTRNLRFSFYKKFNCPVILGHNYDDTLENIFTNLSNLSHYENLLGMKEISTENDVIILRPLIETSKLEIHQLAEIYRIPHLKNSTPTWSKRGQMRDTLIPSIHKFNPHIIKGLTQYISHTNHLQNEWNHSMNEYTHSIIQNTFIQLPFNDFAQRNYTFHTFWIEIWKYIQLKKWPSHKATQNMIHYLLKQNRIVLSPSLQLQYQPPYIYIISV
jgi:tRNA(Ile)-lysidine synthase TilS/MesJ